MHKDWEALTRHVIHLDKTNVTPNVWGGNWILKWKGLEPSSVPMGEAWEFSGYKARPNWISLGEGARVSLPDLIAAFPDEVLGPEVARKRGAAAPFLFKFIDARDNLSVQVHPDDAYAARVERGVGKAETWAILGTGIGEDEGFIYVGFNPDFCGKWNRTHTIRENFLAALKKASQAAPGLLAFMNRVKVKPGEVYHLEPGTIHAIGKGVRLCEIQQNSDLTYRVWDWNRPAKNRPLHVDKSLDVLNFSPYPPAHFLVAKKDLPKGQPGVTEHVLVINEKAGYALNRLVLERRCSVELKTGGRFLTLTVYRGSVLMSAGSFGDADRVPSGQTVLIPAQAGVVKVAAESAEAELFKCTVPEP